MPIISKVEQQYKVTIPKSAREALGVQVGDIVEMTMSKDSITVRRKATPRARVDRQSSLKAQIKEGAIKRVRRDAGLAEEWFILDEEAWQNERG